jgi:hypothetical protein
LNRLPLFREIPAAIGAALLLLVLASCTVPLAPDYQILKQSCEVRFIPGANPEIRVHNIYTLQNSGTTPLDFIDATFPDDKIFGRTDFRVEVGGQTLSPENLPLEYQQGSPGAQRLTFRSSWPTKGKLELVVDYTFVSPEGSGEGITLAADNFHLGTRGWLPVLLPPNHILASAPARPVKMPYSVRVPGNFVVLARGASAGRKQDSAGTTHLFELGKNDLAPFIVAGHYANSSENKKVATPGFWTTQPSLQNQAGSTDRLAAAWSVLQKNFGSLDKRNAPPYLVESSALRSDVGDSSGAAFAAFPGGALVNPAAVALGFNNGVFMEGVERSLAQTWFGDALQPAPAAQFALGEGLPAYATIVIAEANGGDAERRKRTLDLMNSYDDASKQIKTPEKAVTATTPADSVEQRRIACAKAALLFIALEDAYGEAPVRAALAQAVQLLRGKDVSVNDVRAAIEYTTGKNLAGTFRVWLYNPGVPSDFRSRYGATTENGKSKKGIRGDD